MYEHPFLGSEDIPKYIPIEALTTVPNFKASGKAQDPGPSLIRVKSSDKLKAQDFTKRKLQLNLNLVSNGNKQAIDGMHSPRNVFNSEVSDRAFRESQNKTMDK